MKLQKTWIAMVLATSFVTGVWAATPVVEESNEATTDSTHEASISLSVTATYSPIDIISTHPSLPALPFDNFLLPAESISEPAPLPSSPALTLFEADRFANLRGQAEKEHEIFLFSLLPLPEPGGFLAIGTGLAGLVGYSMRRRRHS